jgi:uncharacterized membrane protein
MTEQETTRCYRCHSKTPRTEAQDICVVPEGAEAETVDMVLKPHCPSCVEEFKSQ